MNRSDNGPSNKVTRLIEKYECDGLGLELEERWTADDETQLSLRELADHFNKRLVEHRLKDAGMTALESDVNVTYKRLTEDTVSRGVRTDTRNRLERNGINVEELESDFVSYQSIRRHLRDRRGVEYEHISDEEKIEKDRESIQQLVTRTQTVIDDRIRKLSTTGRVDFEEFQVVLNPQILCQNCGTQYTVEELFEQQGCSCQ